MSLLQIVGCVYLFVGLVFSLLYYVPLFLRAMKKEDPKVVEWSDLLTFTHSSVFF